MARPNTDIHRALRDACASVMFSAVLTLVRILRSEYRAYYFAFAVAAIFMATGAALLRWGVDAEAHIVVLAGLVVLALSQVVLVGIGIAALWLAVRLLMDLYSGVRHDIRERRKSQTQ